MKTFFELLENIKSADKKPEIYTKPDGKKGTRMIPVDKDIVKTEEAGKIKELTAAEKKLVNQMYDKKGNLTPLGKKVMNHGKKPGDRGYVESVDREAIKQEKTLEWLKSALAREAKATKPRQDDMEEQTEATMYCKDCGCEKGNPDPNCTCPNDNAQLKASQCTTEQSKCKSRKAEAMESVKEDDDEDHRPHTHALVDKKGHAHGFAPYKLRNAHVVKDRNGDTRETSDDHDYAKKRAKRFGGTVVSTKAVKLKKPMDHAHAVKQVGKSIKGHYHEATEAKEDVSELTIADVQKATAMAKKRQEKERKAGKKSVSTADLAARMPKKEAHDPKHVKQAVGIASDPRYKGGNMTGATKTINKLSKGLSDHPQVKAVLKRQNEGVKTFAEISKGMAGRYIKKAQVSTADAAKSTERGYADSRSPDRDIAKAGSNQAKKGIKTFVNRNKGTSTAVNKLTGKAKVPAK